MTSKKSLNNDYRYLLFGMQIPGRTFTGSNKYRFGFNGYEKESDWNGIDGGMVDFGARIHDPRLGRFLSIDPEYKKFTSWSPYVFAANNPIAFIDEFGEGPREKIVLDYVNRLLANYNKVTARHHVEEKMNEVAAFIGNKPNNNSTNSTILKTPNIPFDKRAVKLNVSGTVKMGDGEYDVNIFFTVRDDTEKNSVSSMEANFNAPKASFLSGVEGYGIRLFNNQMDVGVVIFKSLDELKDLSCRQGEQYAIYKEYYEKKLGGEMLKEYNDLQNLKTSLSDTRNKLIKNENRDYEGKEWSSYKKGLNTYKAKKAAFIKKYKDDG